MASQFKDQITHAADVAKWKYDQQSRIIKIQSQLSDYENQVRKNKGLLADKVFDMFGENKVTDPNLISICEEINTVNEAVSHARMLLEQAKAEKAPVFKPLPDMVTVLSGLVCPQCGKELTGKFCPVHGVAGVKPEQPETPISSSGLICPQCGKPVAVKFCATCGIEGIPVGKKEEDDKPETESKQAEGKAIAQEIAKAAGLICPKCGKPVKKKFCNDCGVEGVPAPQ